MMVVIGKCKMPNITEDQVDAILRALFSSGLAPCLYGALFICGISFFVAVYKLFKGKG